jgi:hypothetical protein
MTIPAGHRFEATKALRQVLARAAAYDDRSVNAADVGGDRIASDPAYRRFPVKASGCSP